MSLLFLLKGIAVGLSISAPVGPMGLLCIRRTLAWGRACGIVTGLGVATADLFYSSVAAFGLATISGVLIAQGGWLRMAGGIVLCGLGLRIFFGRPPAHGSEPEQTAAQAVSRYSAAYLSALALALSNPIGIVFFMSFFSGMGLADTGGNMANSALLVMGVFSGSLLWWLLLSSGVAYIGGRLSQRVLVRVSQLSGILILGFAVLMLVRA